MNLKVIFPCAFTTGNLISGFLAITSAMSGHYQTAAGFICLGAVLDSLDGLLARAVHGQSHFGRQFDSFSDFLTFGVAPMVLVYPFLLHHIGFWSWIISGFYMVAGAFRLVRFNLDETAGHEKSFQGLPITSGGITLAGYVLFSHQLTGTYAWPGLISGLIIGLAVFMISSIRFPKFRLFRQSNPVWLKFLLSILFALPLIIRPRIMIFIMILGYTGLALVMEIGRYFIHRKTDERIFH